MPRFFIALGEKDKSYCLLESFKCLCWNTADLVSGYFAGKNNYEAAWMWCWT
jgi:hypothetical protein